MHFTPRLEILPPPQRRLWDELSAIPDTFTLWGGTALALHLGHRASVDFDLFSDAAVDLQRLERRNVLLRDARIVQREPDALTALVDRDGPVQLSFFVVPGVLRPTRSPLIMEENGLKIASLPDVAAMKLKVLPERAEPKDYIDIAAVLTHSHLGLADVFNAARSVYGPRFEPLPSLKALTYFSDKRLATLPDNVKATLSQAVDGLTTSVS